MTRNSWVAIAAAGTVLLALPSTGAAQTKSTTEGVSEAHVQELVRAAALRAGVSGTIGALPQSAASQSTPVGSGPELSLTLDDAIKLALDRNLDIAVQRLNPQTFDFSVAALRANYAPALTSTVGTNSLLNPSQSTLTGVPAGATGITTDTATFNGGINQNLKWGGGNILGTLNNSRVTSDSIISTINPAYSTSYSLNYTQPLLRNFKIDTTRQQLVVTNLNQDISEIQLQALIINTVSNVRNAYWDYVFATQSVDVAKRSVELAEQLVRDNQTRVEIGTMAPIDVVQAQSQAATQRQNLAAAYGTLRTNELVLKRLIVGGTQDPNWNSTINATDRPDFVPTPIDLPAAVRRALDNRTDLQQAKKNLQVNDVTMKYMQNQTLPQMDFNARYGLAGRGGTVLQRATSTGINGVNPIVASVPGGFNDALQTMFASDFPTWTFQVNVTYPIGTSTADANLARAKIQTQQVEAQLKQIELQIATDVTNAAVSVQSNVERVQAAVSAREFAQKQLEAEQSKFEVGMSTNYFVVQAQRDLATAQNNELQAVLAYRRSLVELERLQQTSLTTSNITIVGR